MKTFSLFFLVLAITARLMAQDDSQEVLQNPDFSDGSTYWHGDCKPAASDMTTDFTSSNPSSAAGIIVDLHSSSWTRVTQELRDKPAPANAVLTITYQTSADFKLSDRRSDYDQFAHNVGFANADIPASPKEIVAFIDVPPVSRSAVTGAANGVTEVTIYHDDVCYAPLTPVTAPSPQTFTVTMRPPPATEDDHQTLCLAFPPGNGSITITKISLTPAAPGAGAPPNP